MGALAAWLPPEEPNRVRLRRYERFRPDVPVGAEGWSERRIAINPTLTTVADLAKGLGAASSNE